MISAFRSRGLRATLLASAATAVFAVSAPAFADPTDDPTSVATSSAPRPVVDQAQLDPQIVIANPGTPTTARDPENVTGVGQMVIDQQNGFIGLCTATLINPRTVIFAAHCVNERDATAYGTANGGTPIGFGFSNYNLGGIRSWYLPGSEQYKTNTGLYFYNSNYVAYNEHSLEPDAGSFRYGDVAVAGLDTPASDIPTWALLFSQLPQTEGGANGTGYHVVIDGYGNNGTGTSGSTGGIDYRRRIAENTLGALASLDDFEGWLFGQAPGLPQNLYWIDFDDPRRGTAQASVFDFNAWRDNALPHEGITASGDSGGPLILDQEYDIPVVIGVLSGGYTRFFNGQPANGYGTASFYQPLYLYWDWIAANNPYHYVSAKAGNGAWEDSAHWVSVVDPNYMILDSNGNLVNGVPTAPGEQNVGTDGKFGEMCFQSGGISECYNLATDEYTIEAKPIGTSATNDMATVSAGSLVNGGLSDGSAVAQVVGASQAAGTGTQMTAADGQLPAPTIDNGLPGATNFVPNNDEGMPAQGVKPKYFDVTLSASGTTTLSSAVTVDRFAIDNGLAELSINSGGALTSNIDVTQWTGSMTVNGTLTTPGDYLMVTGGLTGSGTINTPYFTSMAGTIAPGTPTSVGTLTFNGNVILASGTRYLVDVSPSGASDKIAVNATEYANQQAPAGTQAPAAVVPLDGFASIGGSLGINITGVMEGSQLYTILTSEGGIQGMFDSPDPISAILTPSLVYSANAVQLRIDVGSYAGVISPNSPVQRAYAILLDRNRPNASQFEGIYAPLDMQDAATIRSTLDGLAPASETTVRSLGTAAIDAQATMTRDRLRTMDPTDMGGSVAMIGRPVQVAANNLSGVPMMTPDIRSDAAPMQVQQGKLPENMRAYVAAGYLDGDSSSMIGATSVGRDQYNGWFVSGGLETSLDDRSALGFSLNYTHVEGDAAFGVQSAWGDLYSGTLYGKAKLGGGFTLDAQISAGAFDTSTKRVGSFLGSPYTLKAQDTAFVFNAEAGMGYDFDLGAAKITPRLAARATEIGFTPTIETGGPTALRYDRQAVKSLQGRAGMTAQVTRGPIRPFVTGTWVHDFEDTSPVFGATFVGSTAAPTLFDLNSTDKDWGEVSGGLTFSSGAVDLSFSAESTIARQNLSAQTYRGSVSIKF
ncbi:MAG: autotransporter domain-containing protein [Pseudomonadota bacterium]